MLLAEWSFPAIDPVIFDLPGELAVRWYGVTYLVAFGCGLFLLRYLGRKGFLPLDRDGVGDFIVWAVGGVLIGGRLGWTIFYGHDQIESFWDVFKVWKGGMSFHGGLIGMIIVFFWFARRRGFSGWRMADAGALAATPGIFAVRIANFIKGELYGRVTDSSVPWAMRFPTDPAAAELLDIRRLPTRDKELRILEAFEDGTWERIRDQVPLRHPSQLYEALGEGILLGLALWGLWWFTRKKTPAPGSFAAIFLFGYGAVRFVIEFFRQPDAQFRNEGDPLGTVLGPLSMGQVLCAAMMLGAIGIWVFARRYQRATAASRSR
jgi:phosphatidylglycerol:prolipoprotein diacylglycerol transferase